VAKRTENAFIFICNVSLEYEKSEVNAGFFYKDAEERAKLVNAERKYTDDKVREVIAFRDSVCVGDKKDYGFIVINQKGIDPISLDILQKAGIVGIRRAKRRNMERLAKACGGYAVNAMDGIDADCLGFAELVYEHTLGEDKFTFVEGCKNATSCTILIRGPNDFTIRQIKDAIRDGLRAVVNVIEDQATVAGAGAFEVMAHLHLLKTKSLVQGRNKLGYQAFADALLVIPKTLAANSGQDVQASLIALLEAGAKGQTVGLDLDTGKPLLPIQVGIWDNHRVKKQFLHLGTLIAVKLLLVDEVMRAGRKMGKG
jgi:T-complex protein 1 subunit zeta